MTLLPPEGGAPQTALVFFVPTVQDGSQGPLMVSVYSLVEWLAGFANHLATNGQAGEAECVAGIAMKMAAQLDELPATLRHLKAREN